MDQQRFLEACEQIIQKERATRGIGTLGEKTLHAVLKQYFEPDVNSQEVKVGGYVADIVGENGIIEIQTANFNRLRDKLTAFLECAHVTVVYPIPAVKWLCWIDPETQQISKKRKSPRKGTVYDAFTELYKIKSFLKHENLTLCFVLLELEEYRILNGWSKDRKKGSHREERIPVALLDEIYIHRPSDYRVCVPKELPTQFTVKDYAKAAKISLSAAGTALHVLNAAGAVLRTGKQGRSYLYQSLV